MATAAFIPVEEYLATSYRPDCDYVDGRLEERNLGELDHGLLQLEIGFWFRSNAAAWGIRASTETRIRTSPNRFRIPDILIMRMEQPREPVLLSPPLIVVEVLSPRDSPPSMEANLRDYASFGIPHIWVLDPAARRSWRWSGGSLLESERLEVPGTAIHIPLPGIFKVLDS